MVLDDHPENYLLNIVYFILIFLVIIFCFTAIYNYHNPLALVIHSQPSISNHSDMTYFPHYVKFHLEPPAEGVIIIVGGQYQQPTDSNSDAVFELVPVVLYSITVPQRNLSFKLYPRDNYYILWSK